MLDELKRKEDAEKNKNREFFKDQSGKLFDPTKKFGMIEDGNQLVYDNLTTSYVLNLPPEYYIKMIQQQLPAKDNQKFFIKPHHIESITNHHNSIKDEVLNTHYFSHHNKDFNAKKEVNDKELCIEYVEKHIQNLKMQQTTIAMQRGIDMDAYDVKNKMELSRKVQEKFEKLVREKTDGNGKELCITAYEMILLDKRRQELEKLNQFRHKEIEKNRLPEPGWYMKTTTDFRDELYRNRVSLKPNDTNKVYLNTLRDPHLY